MGEDATTPVEQWVADCERHYGKVLAGPGSHWCHEWDGLPIDETCPEFDACLCYRPEVKAALNSRKRKERADG